MVDDEGDDDQGDAIGSIDQVAISADDAGARTLSFSLGGLAFRIPESNPQFRATLQRLQAHYRLEATAVESALAVGPGGTATLKLPVDNAL